MTQREARSSTHNGRADYFRLGGRSIAIRKAGRRFGLGSMSASALAAGVSIRERSSATPIDRVSRDECVALLPAVERFQAVWF
jgi:hypothetical protein